ncbi:MAG: cache domain-containing protein [Nitrospirae bacterium]|nr:cache domain-containing protein [Nitrospirota bacterium]
MRLKPKLIASFLLASLAPMGLLGYLNYWSARESLKRQILNDLTLVAEAKEGHLYGFLEAVKGRAVDFASDGFIRQHLEAMRGLDPKSPRFIGLQRALDRHLKNKQPLDRSIRSISVIDATRDLDKVLSGAFQVEKGAQTGARGRMETIDIYLVNKDGLLITSSRLGGEVMKQRVETLPILGMRNGAPLGAIVNFYDTRDLDKVLSGEFQVEKGAQTGARGRMETIDIYLVNKDGLLITSSRLGGEVMKQRVETLPPSPLRRAGSDGRRRAPTGTTWGGTFWGRRCASGARAGRSSPRSTPRRRSSRSWSSGTGWSSWGPASR